MKTPTSCGFGKSLFLRPPYWAFIDSSCFTHDENYEKGGTKKDRLKADVGFYKHMILDIEKIEDYKKRKRAMSWAIVYYLLVRLFGWISFNYDK